MEVTRRHHIVTGWLIGMLALSAANPLWTLWRIPDDGNAVRLETGLEHHMCEALVLRSTRAAEGPEFCVEIQWDIVMMSVPCKRKPARLPFHFRCRPDDEAPPD